MSGSGGLATSRQTSETVLAPDADAPRAARDFAAGTVRRWGVPDWGEPLGLVVSELVTNAVRHAGTPAALRLVPADGGVLVEVDDGEPREPRLVPAGSRTASGGLGLAIVDRLADAWGCSVRPDGSGKTVWARLSLPEEPWPRPSPSWPTRSCWSCPSTRTWSAWSARRSRTWPCAPASNGARWRTCGWPPTRSSPCCSRSGRPCRPAPRSPAGSWSAPAGSAWR
ncbi:ATP-binding protein [Catenulispora yoronensis]